MTAFTHSARGILNILVWIFSNGNDVLPLLYSLRKSKKVFHDTEVLHDELLKPQLNLALRKQVIQMATRGIVEANEHYQELHQSIKTNQLFHLDWDNRTATSSSENSNGKQVHVIHPNSTVATKLGRSIQEMGFYDFQPRIFAAVRSLSGIDEQEYVRSFRHTANERLSEGRSGAFVFNTINRKYLVKSMTRQERDFLLSILPAYLQYLKWNPSTMLPRFYGAHAMKM